MLGIDPRLAHEVIQLRLELLLYSPIRYTRLELSLSNAEIIQQENSGPGPSMQPALDLHCAGRCRDDQEV